MPRVPAYKRHLFVCLTHRPPRLKPSCGARASEAVLDALRAEVERRGLGAEIGVTGSTCLGPCESDAGPVAVVYPEGVWYARLSVGDAAEVVEQHLVGGRPVERLLWKG